MQSINASWPFALIIHWQTLCYYCASIFCRPQFVCIAEYSPAIQQVNGCVFANYYVHDSQTRFTIFNIAMHYFASMHVLQYGLAWILLLTE
jgi:hypothetical protein